MRTLPRRAAFLAVSLSLVIAGGCNLDVLSEQLQTAAEQTQLVGVSGNTLVLTDASFGVGAFDDLFTNPSAAPPPATYRVYSVDLESAAIKVIEESASGDAIYGSPEDAFFSGYGYSGGPLSTAGALLDDTWLVKLNYEEGYVSVTETATGVETRYLDAVADGADVRLRGLAADHVLLSINPPNGADGLLVTIDLRSGDQLVMDRVAPFYPDDGVAFDGQRVAFVGVPDFDPATQSLEESLAPSTLDLVDVVTGQRETLVGDLSVWDTHGVFFDGGQVIWLESDDEGYFVRAVDVSTKAVTTRDQFAARDGDSVRNLYDVNAKAVLLGQSETSGVPTSIFDLAAIQDTETITLRTFDGKETRLLSYTTAGLELGYSTIITLTDNYAVVHDPTADELIVYTLATGEFRRIALPN